jgi:putative transposase
VSKDNVIKLIQPGCSTINSPKSCAMEPVRCSPRQSKPRAKRALQEIWMAETKAAAELAFDAFIESYSLKYDKAADCLERIETTFRILRLPGRALETTADDQPDRKHLRYRAPPHIRSKVVCRTGPRSPWSSNWSRAHRKAGAVSMATTSCQNSSFGVTFKDGIEVIAKPTDRQPITAAA